MMFANLEEKIKTIKSTIDDPEALAYENIVSAQTAAADALTLVQSRMDLIERVEDYGAGGWAVATEFQLMQQRGSNDTEISKSWAEAIKKIKNKKTEEKEKKPTVGPKQFKGTVKIWLKEDGFNKVWLTGNKYYDKLCKEPF
jgi:hypothetical protein